MMEEYYNRLRNMRYYYPLGTCAERHEIQEFQKQEKEKKWYYINMLGEKYDEDFFEWVMCDADKNEGAGNWTKEWRLRHKGREYSIYNWCGTEGWHIATDNEDCDGIDDIIEILRSNMEAYCSKKNKPKLKKTDKVRDTDNIPALLRGVCETKRYSMWKDYSFEPILGTGNKQTRKGKNCVAVSFKDIVDEIKRTRYVDDYSDKYIEKKVWEWMQKFYEEGAIEVVCMTNTEE